MWKSAWVNAAAARVTLELMNGFSVQEQKARQKSLKKDVYALPAKFTPTIRFRVTISAIKDHLSRKSFICYI
jgi:hypothetical protein